MEKRQLFLVSLLSCCLGLCSLAQNQPSFGDRGPVLRQKDQRHRAQAVLSPEGSGAGTALEFGPGKYVDAGNSPGLNITGSLTLETWIYPTSADIVDEIVQKADVDYPGYQLRTDVGGMNFLIGSTNSLDGTGFGPIGLNAWHHLAGVYDGSSIRCYIDGNLVANKATSVVLASNTRSLKIGARNDGLNFRGKIEEVRVWNTARSSEEIREHMHLRLSGNETGLAGYWRFDEGTGGTAYDSSGHGNNGTLIGQPNWVSSTVPLGDGASFNQEVGATGSFPFPGTDISMNVTRVSGTSEIVATAINNVPGGALPNGGSLAGNRYWVIEKYGDGFCVADIAFSEGGGIFSMPDSTYPGRIKLFQRGPREDGAWTKLASSVSVLPSTGEVTFLGLSHFAQVAIVRGEVVLEPAQLNFGGVGVGRGMTDSITVTNTGAQQLDVWSVTSDNAQFAASPASGTVPPAQSMKFLITFTPARAGIKTGNLSFKYTAPDSSDNLAVNGIGIGSDLAVNVYYYPWYTPGNPHWPDGYLRSRLVPPQYPLMGTYSSIDPALINQHLQWSENYGIDNWICSWWGPGSNEDNALLNFIAPAMRGRNVTYCVYYESAILGFAPQGLIVFDSSKTAIFRSQLRYIAAHFFSDPNYQRINDRPVVHLYLSRIYSGSYAQALLLSRQDLLSMGYDVYLIGDEVDWGTPSVNHILSLDGITSYSMLGGPAMGQYPSESNFISNVADQYKLFRSAAQNYNRKFIPDIIPGYNDRAVRLAANNLPLPRQYRPDSSSTSTFSQFVAMFEDLLDTSLNSVAITSFNEWHEDTEIEPATVAPPTAQDNSPDGSTYTRGFSYEGYGIKYLELIRQLMHSGLISHSINATSGSGGSITPGGNVIVDHSRNQAFRITPAPGYSLVDLQVDGRSVSPETLYVFNNVRFNHSIASTFGPPSVTIVLNHQERWNLVSNPVGTQKDSVRQLFPTSLPPYGFIYDSTGKYSVQHRLAKGRGYWVRFQSAGIDSLKGSPKTRDTIAVQPGWNMIGSLSSPVDVHIITSAGGGTLTSDFYRYAGNYVKCDTIFPGEGYWVKVNQSCSLILAAENPTLQSNRIQIRGISELPPSPPAEYTTKNGLPADYSLGQAYPNPFNGSLTIGYDLPVDSKVKLKIYNTLGQVVAVLIEKTEEAGYKSVRWNGVNVPSAVYFCRLEAISTADPGITFTAVRKLLLLK